MDVHGKESCGAIGKINISRKSTLMPENKSQDTKRKHERNYVKVEDNTPGKTLDISDNEVNKKMKTRTTTTTAMKITETATKRKSMDVEMRTK